MEAEMVLVCQIPSGQKGPLGFYTFLGANLYLDFDLIIPFSSFMVSGRFTNLFNPFFLKSFSTGKLIPIPNVPYCRDRLRSHGTPSAENWVGNMIWTGSWSVKRECKGVSKHYFEH